MYEHDLYNLEIYSKVSKLYSFIKIF